jgi:hypothetical protein
MDNLLEANKRIVREWHDLAINQRKPEETVANIFDRTIGSTIPAQQMVLNLLLRL